LVQLEVEGAGVAVLGGLGEEHHQEGDDGGGGVDGELPAVRVVEQRPADRPGDHRPERQPERPVRTDLLGRLVGPLPEVLRHARTLGTGQPGRYSPNTRRKTSSTCRRWWSSEKQASISSRDSLPRSSSSPSNA